ncbi:MAG: DUF2007 domain-containing protein [Pseudomonadota bacterium]
MKVIERTHDINMARIVVSFLRAHGVDARLLDAETSTMMPVVTGGVRIAVPDDEEMQAKRLIAEMNPDDGDNS